MSPPLAVHHVVDGPADAPLLVLGSSLGATAQMWEPQLPALAERFRVVRYDHRGHGGSPVPPGPYDVADLAGDLLALLDRLGADRAHLCGLSLGGMVAVWVAAHEPGRVGRLVVCCMFPRPEQPSAWAERAARVRAEGTASVAEAVVTRWFTPAFAARRPDLVAEMTAMVAATPAEGYAAGCGVVERLDLEPVLPRILAPTLVVAGADDPAASPRQARRIAALVPGARLEIVPDAAHLANVEQPEVMTRLVLGHLTEETG